MQNFNKNFVQNVYCKLVICLVLFVFVFTSIMPPNVYAQTAVDGTGLLNLPKPGEMLGLTPDYIPSMIKGVKIFPEDPFKFDFIVDQGDSGLKDNDFKEESTRLIKYFLASLTIPEKDIWVNLSPYEKDRIIPGEFGLTEMGRDLLAQDYILKQLTSSLMYPEDELGQKFWDKVYKEAYERFGITNIPIDTFNKVWIVPEKAVVYENKDVAYVVEARLKVMLEEDYVALNEGRRKKDEGRDTKNDSSNIHHLSSLVIKEIIVPAIEKEVNEGSRFAQLRQIYSSLILATWFKNKFKESLLGKIYVEKNKIEGVNVYDKQIKNKIYQRYLEAFKKGVYNYIKEDFDPNTQKIVPRKYFSGGVDFIRLGKDTSNAMTTIHEMKDMPKLSGASEVTVDLAMSSRSSAMISEGLKVIASSEDAINKKERIEIIKARLPFFIYSIYDIYGQLLNENGSRLNISKKDILNKITLTAGQDKSYKFIKAISFIYISMGIISLLKSGNFYAYEHNTLSFICLLCSIGFFGISKMINNNNKKYFFDTEGKTGFLNKRIIIYNALNKRWIVLISTLAHEFAHLFRMPNHKLYANSYGFLIKKKFWPKAGISNSTIIASAGNLFNVIVIINIISQMFQDLSISEKEVLFRKFIKDLFDNKIERVGDLNESIRSYLMDVKSGLVEKDYSIKNVSIEAGWTYEYGTGMGYLAYLRYKNVDSALQYIYLLGKLKDSRKAEKEMQNFQFAEKTPVMSSSSEKAANMDKNITVSKDNAMANKLSNSDLVANFMKILASSNSTIAGIETINPNPVSEYEFNGLGWKLFALNGGKLIELFTKDDHIVAYGIVTIMGPNAILRFHSFEKNNKQGDFWAEVYRERIKRLRQVFNFIKAFVVAADQVLSEDQLAKRARAYFHESDVWANEAIQLINSVRFGKPLTQFQINIVQKTDFNGYYPFGLSANFYVNKLDCEVVPVMPNKVSMSNKELGLLARLKNGEHLSDFELVELFSGRGLLVTDQAMNTEEREASKDNASVYALAGLGYKQRKQLAEFIGIDPEDIAAEKIRIKSPEVPSVSKDTYEYVFDTSSGEKSVFIKKGETYFLEQERRILNKISDNNLGSSALLIHINDNESMLIVAPVLGRSWASIYKKTKGMGITPEMIKSLGKALGRLHKAGITHGDLRGDVYPLRMEHIFSTADGSVKFIDFDRASDNASESDCIKEKMAVLKGLNGWLKHFLTADNIEAMFDDGYSNSDDAINAKIQPKFNKADVGGIDLTPEKLNLKVRSKGDKIEFDIDPAMLQKLQSIPGFTPVIINIQPLTDLPLLLGMPKQDKAAHVTGPLAVNIR